MAKPLFVVIGLLLILVAVALFVRVLDSTRPVSLPIADQASDVACESAVTIEVPLSWGRDLATAKTRLDVIFKEVAQEAKSAQAAGPLSKHVGALISRLKASDDPYGTVTLHMDRRVSYRVLQQALLEGRDAGVWRFQIACRMRGVGGDIGYLVIGWPTNLPGPVKPLQPEPWGLFITMTTEGDEATYLVRETDHPVTWLKPPALDPGKEGPTQGEGPDTQETAKVRSLTEVSTLVGKAVDKNAGLGLVLKCPGDISLQRFIDLYNVAVKSGCKHILLMKPEQEEADQ